MALGIEARVDNPQLAGPFNSPGEDLKAQQKDQYLLK
jgi:hypothetical protein